MILDFGSYIINEASLKKFKRQVHGVLNMSARKRMRKELRDNIITFKFRKRDGTIRTAKGTLHPSYLPKLRGGAPRPEKQMVYYDLEKEAWRSFRSYSFIKILNVKPVSGSGISKPTSTKPVSKPVHKPEEEEEEVKKSVPTKEIEKEKEKKVHTEEKKEKEKEKEKKKTLEIEDEIVDDDDKKSVLDDRDTPEEEEIIKKEKEKEKEEGEEEDDKDQDKEKEK